MRFWIGKILELVGVAMVPWALIRGESGARGALLDELYLVAIAGVIFGIGWLIERGGG